eukprot:gene8292-11222_t
MLDGFQFVHCDSFDQMMVPRSMSTRSVGSIGQSFLSPPRLKGSMKSKIQGWVMKRGDKNTRNWRENFCFIEKSQLCFSQDPDEQAHQAVDLSQCISVREITVKQYNVQIDSAIEVTVNCSKSIVFHEPRENFRKEWLRIIRKVIREAGEIKEEPESPPHQLFLLDSYDTYERDDVRTSNKEAATQKLLENMGMIQVSINDNNEEDSMDIAQMTLCSYSESFLNIQRTDLHNSCHKGYTEMVKQLIAEGADLNSLDEMGRTPLYYACGAAHLNIIKLLLFHGASPNVYGGDASRTNPLFAAIEEGSSETVLMLIQAEADITVTADNGETLLHYAIQLPDPSILRLLESAITEKNFHDYSSKDRLSPVSIARKDSNEMPTTEICGGSPIIAITSKSKLNLNQPLIQMPIFSNGYQNQLSLAPVLQIPFALGISMSTSNSSMHKRSMKNMTQSNKKRQLSSKLNGSASGLVSNELTSNFSFNNPSQQQWYNDSTPFSQTNFFNHVQHGVFHQIDNSFGQNMNFSFNN